MTTKDSTGDKLVASIRKTKSGTVTSTKTAKKKVVKKTAQRTRKKVISAKETKAATSRNSQLIDLLQSGRRVWPD